MTNYPVRSKTTLLQYEVNEEIYVKISIVTPSWNQGKYLRRCLDSIKTAKNIDVEHILLDNCSDDGTQLLLEEFRSRNDGVDRKFFVRRDKGQTYAINDGFRIATGDVVCWLNTDEWFADGTLEKVGEYFKNSSDVDLLYGNCNFVDQSGRMVKERRSMSFNANMLLYYGCFISSAAAFVRRRVIEENEILNPDFRVAMDYEWYVRLATKGYKFAHETDTLSFFTWHDTNISVLNKQRSFEERLLIQRHFGKTKIPDVLRPVSAKLMRIYWMGRRQLRARLTPREKDKHGPRGGW